MKLKFNLPVIATVFISALFLNGCASMFQGSHQNITVATINDKNVDKTRCNVKNEEGSWNAAPNAAVSIHRDGNSMEIKCENDIQTGVNSVEPDFSGGYLGLDFLWDLCTISCLIDGVSNSFYQYPAFITVSMREKSLAFSSSVSTAKQIERTQSNAPFVINSNLIQKIQTALTSDHYYHGDISGELNEDTRNAIAVYKEINNLSGKSIDKAFLNALGIAR